MGYVDVDKFAEKICDFQAIDEDAANKMIWLLRTFPTADVVEVVRCKDCDFRVLTQNGFMCRINAAVTSDNGYCHYGKRKVQEVNNDVR